MTTAVPHLNLPLRLARSEGPFRVVKGSSVRREEETSRLESAGVYRSRVRFETFQRPLSRDQPSLPGRTHTQRQPVPPPGSYLNRCHTTFEAP